MEYTFTGQYYMDDPIASETTEGFGLMFFNARWYDPYLNHFTQPDSIVPDPYNSQDWDRYAYARNNPIRYSDPSGHCVWDGCVIEAIALTTATVVIVSKAVEVVMFGTAPDARGLSYAKSSVANSGDAASTYTAAGIAVQSNYYPLGDLYIPGEHYSAGLGLAQVSQKELDKYLHMSGADPTDPSVAVAAMQKRISMVTKECNGNCSSTDIFIAAALAQNGSGFTDVNMRGLVNGDFGTVNTSDPTKAFLPWGNFLSKIDNSSYYKLMLKLFKNDVLALGNNGWTVPDNINWDQIDDISSGGWRSKIR
jgi:RHS repeat-associated protein